VLDASLGRAERFLRGPRVGCEDRDGFLRRERQAAIGRGQRFLHGGPPDRERLGRSLVRPREVRLREGQLRALASLGGRQTIGFGQVLRRSLRLVRACRELAGAAPKRGADDVVRERPAERVLRDREGVLVSERARGIVVLFVGLAGSRAFATEGDLALRDGQAWGMFVDSSYGLEFDLARENPDRCGFAIDGGPLVYYVFAGPTPRAVLEQIVRSTSQTLARHRPALAMLQNDWSYFSGQPRFGYLRKAVGEELISVAA